MNTLFHKVKHYYLFKVKCFARCSLVFACRLLLFTCCSLLVNFYLLFATCCSLLVTFCSLLFALCLLLFACCLLVCARCSLLFARCLLICPRCLLLFARCLLVFLLVACSARISEGFTFCLYLVHEQFISVLSKSKQKSSRYQFGNKMLNS